MSIKQFQCPNCGAALDYEASRALTMRCPYCATSVIVPESLRAVADTASPDALDSVLDSSQTHKLAEVARLARSGNKIAAIKVFRDTFGSGLKESKDAVDMMAAGQAVNLTTFGNLTVMSNNAVSVTSVSGVDSAEIQRLLQTGNKIAAIKLMREQTGLGLAEAKNSVEAIELALKMTGMLGDREAFQKVGGQTDRYGNPTLMNAHLLGGEESGTTYAQTGSDGSPNLITVVDGAPNFSPKVEGGRRRGGCGTSLVFLIMVLFILAIAPLPWAMIGAAVGMADEDLPTAGENLFEHFTAGGMPSGIALPMVGGEDAAQAPLLSFGTTGTGRGAFTDPRYIALDGDSNVYVAELDTGLVQRFNDEGEFQSLFRLENDNPVLAMVANADGELYIVQGGRVTIYDGMTGDELDTLSFGELFTIVTSVALTPDGGVLITTMTPDERVIRLDRSGDNQLTINQPFESIVEEMEPLMYAVEDGVGSIYVLGRINSTILKFNSQGRFQNQFGAELFQQLSANGLAIDSQGRLYIPHMGGVTVADGDGQLITTIETEGVPYGVTIGKGDTVWVVTSTPKVVQYAAVE